MQTGLAAKLGMPEGAALGILAHASLSMVLTDPGLPDNPVVHVNGAFETATGHPPLEVESGPGGSTFTIAAPRSRRFPL